MSDRIEDGGPAFPQNEFSAYTTDREGMNLRDWFAGHALNALVGNTDAMQAINALSDEHGRDPAEYTSVAAYQYADAMLESRT